MRLLVIGASGFLGRHVWQQATGAGMAVVTAGRAGLPGSPEHLRLDLATADPAELAGLIAPVAPDVVVNCAGATSGARRRMIVRKHAFTSIFSAKLAKS